MKVSKLVRGLSDLINLSRRLAIWRLGRMKLNCSQQNYIICMLLELKSFMRNRFATKSREFSWDLFRFDTSKPYSRIGIHLYFTKCSIYILGALAPDGILHGAKFTLRLSLAFSYIGSVTARYRSSGRQPNFAAWQGMELRNYCGRCLLHSAGRPSRWVSAHILVLTRNHIWNEIKMF